MAYQQRVIDELKQLTELREKLGQFIVSPSPFFHGLPEDEQARLFRQHNIMIQYEQVLQERIDHF